MLQTIIIRIRSQPAQTEIPGHIRHQNASLLSVQRRRPNFCLCYYLSRLVLMPAVHHLVYYFKLHSQEDYFLNCIYGFNFVQIIIKWKLQTVLIIHVNSILFFPGLVLPQSNSIRNFTHYQVIKSLWEASRLLPHFSWHSAIPFWK